MADWGRVVAAFEAAQRRQARRPVVRSRAEASMLVVAARRPRAPRPVAVASGVARVDLMDEIGLWGVTAADFVDELLGIDAGTIELHISSPGGDVFDGVAMFNALRDHPARVEVVVDGIAASAASFVAMAGDSVRMNRSSSLMIHDAMTVTGGNEADHLRSAELLGRVSDTIAGIYAARAGGDVAGWRDLMRAETWYSPLEAVEAGLADELVTDDEPEPDFAGLAAVVRSAFRSAAS